jgi:hypothetical protein
VQALRLEATRRTLADDGAGVVGRLCLDEAAAAVNAGPETREHSAAASCCQKTCAITSQSTERARRSKERGLKEFCMKFITNMWCHPKTSAAGLLIAVVSIAGVLSQQGLTLGKAGTGTVVSLASALATALLGLLAKDPGDAGRQRACESLCQQSCASQCRPTNGQTSQQARLSVWMLIALLIPLPWMQGCSATTVAQNIVNWTPALQSAVATVDSTAALLAAADAPTFAAATVGFDAATNLLASQAQAYLANPSASLLVQLQSQIVSMQQQVNIALLQAAKIIDAKSQQHALMAIQGVGTVVAAILSLVQSISSKAQVARMASQSSIKLANVLPYLDNARSAQIVATHYNEPVLLARAQVAEAEQFAITAGF